MPTVATAAWPMPLQSIPPGICSRSPSPEAGSGMKIAIASGKGGTGKSTVAANLAWALARSRDVVLVDCDVEEPNLHLFFPAAATDVPVTAPVPEIDSSKCNLCGECGKFCRFGALA
ncbi:MAG: P-loop NTPase, partial [Methanomicrobiales archaeon]|nr:P-loop NTPase [Methanomicrobiales archaeon]